MSQEYIKELIKNLNELKPYKAILFGSYAHETPHEKILSLLNLSSKMILQREPQAFMLSNVLKKA